MIQIIFKIPRISDAICTWFTLFYIWHKSENNMTWNGFVWWSYSHLLWEEAVVVFVFSNIFDCFCELFSRQFLATPCVDKPLCLNDEKVERWTDSISVRSAMASSLVQRQSRDDLYFECLLTPLFKGFLYFIDVFITALLFTARLGNGWYIKCVFSMLQ